MKQSPKPAGPPPTRAQLHDAALRHIARFSTTEAGLVRVLGRRVDRWARAATEQGQDAASAVGGARTEVLLVARALVEGGLIDDQQFAAARAKRLTRAGRSRRAVTAHLVGKGIAAETVAAALPGVEQELPSALAYAKRRRIGPFGAIEDAAPDGPAGPKSLAAFARAGFSREVAERALQMDRGDAEAMVLALKRG